MIPQCGAKAKMTGNPCQRYPCKNGKCHLHGGKSSGPKTKKGKHQQKQAVTKHGYYSKEAINEKLFTRRFIKLSKSLISNLEQEDWY